MARNETTDMVAAFLIGAALGVGATLLMREEDEGQVIRVVRGLRNRGKSPARRRFDAARGTGRDLVRSGRHAARSLRDDAGDIVAAARDEILALARAGVRRVRDARS